MSDPTSPPPVENRLASPNTAPAIPPSKSNQWRKVAAQIIGILVVCGAAVLAFWVWNITERHPRTDDATARANVESQVQRPWDLWKARVVGDIKR